MTEEESEAKRQRTVNTEVDTSTEGQIQTPAPVPTTTPAPTTKRPSAEALQRRKEGRVKAAQTIAENLKKTGIGRVEDANKFGLTSVKPIPLINQKNYFTEYLRKDEQVGFIRNWRRERLLLTKIKQKVAAALSTKTNFDNFDLNEIEAEMKQNAAATAAAAAAAAAEEEEEDEDNEEVTEEKAKLGHDTIVIHLGSAYSRIGRATDAVPLTVPTVIAVPRNGEPLDTEIHPKRSEDENGETNFGEEFEEAKAIMTKDFKARMRFYKRRILPNSRETASNFNKKQEAEKIPDHNDPYKKEWLNLNEHADKKFFVGDEALKIPITEGVPWKLRYPIINGTLNEHLRDYKLFQELLGDIADIILDLLLKLEITKLQLPQLKAIFVIPDLYDKMFVEQICGVLFKYVGFGKVAVIQESVAATFGAGALSACVIDVGAQTTSVSCVDEGLVITESRVKLQYGGDNVTETFVKMLLENSFPYLDINLTSRNDDWELAQQLKHDYATFQDADIAVQLYNFYKRKPGQTTAKYEFKVFDEVMLAPLGLFYPQVFQVPEDGKDSSIPSVHSSRKVDNTHVKHYFTPSIDQYTGRPNNPTSKAQTRLLTLMSYCDLNEEDLLIELSKNRTLSEHQQQQQQKVYPPLEDLHTIPLEKAIVESITAAGLATDLGKIRKYYDNLLLVGGGFAKISGCDLILSDRINIWRPRILSSSSFEDVLAYVGKEVKQTMAARKQLINAAKQRKQQLGEKQVPVDDIELSQEEMDEIEEEKPIKLNLERIDEMLDKGSILSANVLPPPREFDPVMLTWKGGSVYGRLKVAGEMWITLADWDLLESRCLYFKSIFNY